MDAVMADGKSMLASPCFYNHTIAVIVGINTSPCFHSIDTPPAFHNHTITVNISIDMSPCFHNHTLSLSLPLLASIYRFLFIKII
jgi:hypothetical protein